MGTVIRISNEVRDALDELRWRFQSYSYNEVIECLLGEFGIEPFNEDEVNDDE